MKIENMRALRIALICGFAFSCACSLHESLTIFKLALISIDLDRFAPNLGNAEFADEHQHAMQMYPYTLIALCFGYCLWLTRTRRDSPPESLQGVS